MSGALLALLGCGFPQLIKDCPSAREISQLLDMLIPKTGFDSCTPAKRGRKGVRCISICCCARYMRDLRCQSYDGRARDGSQLDVAHGFRPFARR